MNKLLVIGLLVVALFLVGCGEEGATGGAAITGADIIDTKMKASCTDSDNGIDDSVQGVVTVIDEDGDDSEYTDDCVAGLLIEYYCDGVNRANQNVRCNKCLNGKCV